ncbi:MAG: hypothetical protein PHI98_04285 [Eubacteriales bacterium]|nr:hypothetical protein [Eubacteriales bacterium]
MPAVQYCRKCKTEVPLGDSCPHCGGKLAKAGEQLSFGVVRRPLRDWFEWNRFLRIGLPVLALVFLSAVGAELISGGVTGIIALFKQGFLGTLLWLLAGLLALIALLLWIQGGEKIHFVLDREGVKAYSYLPEPSILQLYARFLTPGQVEQLAEQEPQLPGLTLVRRVILPWTEIRRVRVWREGSVLLFFRPSCWQALAVSCPVQELDVTEAYVRAKLKRFKKVKILPLLKPQEKARENVTGT